MSKDVKMTFVAESNQRYFGELDGKILSNAKPVTGNFNEAFVQDYIKERNLGTLSRITLGEANTAMLTDLSPEEDLMWQNCLNQFELAKTRAPRMLENMSFDNLIGAIGKKH